ncbi:hypothetical protein CSOJ01_05988 [Colletotrichum sojae]|uniref:Uncharacterized protein n=1 Tax=Colletotrichum sojae TaxID=2175907 RepID=A0A8H6JDE8_9PEZI|nr:hypothetical protein CSOJ01_05988 [Colletotrichum sojae]
MMAETEMDGDGDGDGDEDGTSGAVQWYGVPTRDVMPPQLQSGAGIVTSPMSSSTCKLQQQQQQEGWTETAMEEGAKVGTECALRFSACLTLALLPFSRAPAAALHLAHAAHANAATSTPRYRGTPNHHATASSPPAHLDAVHRRPPFAVAILPPSLLLSYHSDLSPSMSASGRPTTSPRLASGPSPFGPSTFASASRAFRLLPHLLDRLLMD